MNTEEPDLDPALLAIVEALAEAQARRDHAEMRAAGPAISRLRLALQLEGQEGEDAKVLAAVMAAFVDQLPAGVALLLERRIVRLAEAAEALGPAASPREIVDRALQLEGKPS